MSLLLNLLIQLKHQDDRLAYYPESAPAYEQRAKTLWQLGLNSLAIEDARVAAALAHAQASDFLRELVQVPQWDFSAERGRGYFLAFEEMLKYDRELRDEMVFPLYYSERATALQSFQLFELAKRDFTHALNGLAQLPESENEIASVKASQSLLFSLIGETARGGELYEARWQSAIEMFQMHLTHRMLIPRWQGEALENGRLVLLAEQGLGDNIQYVRYAIALKRLGLDVVVLNYPNLNDFLAFNLAREGISATAKISDVRATHFVQMMSLPQLLDPFWQNVPYRAGYLQVEPDFIAQWQPRLLSSKRKIGFVFGGSFEHTRNQFRSIPVALWQGLFGSDAEFHCLQIAIDEADKAYLAGFENVFVWDSAIASFSDTAALIHQLDLVITVDTSVAHLSAAMGKPTWILLIYKPDFRWQLERETSVWYESARLFRQGFDYDWQSTLIAVEQALTHWLVV